MPMLLHELHPMLIHAPLVLLPVSSAVEIAAAGSSWPASVVIDRVGRKLWWATALSALGAGLAGMAASREVRVEDRRAEDAMFVHGLGNFTLVLAALGVATWRSGHRASAATAALGVGAVGAALYTAYLGGELVYAHGLGVKSSRAGSGDQTPLLSSAAPARLARDAASGLGWLLSRGFGLVRGKDQLDLRAVAPGGPQATEPVMTRPEA